MAVNRNSQDAESSIKPLLTGTGMPLATSTEFEPLGADADCPGCNPEDIPQTTDQLGELLSYTYDMAVRRAGELNIPVVGTVNGGFDRRVVVYEWTRYKELLGTNGIKCRYGYVIRFCLTVSKLESQAKISLPFLSAQAELGNVQASWLMQVRGLVGPKIDEVILPPQELKVETFVIARQSLLAAIKAVSDASTQFHSGILLARIDPTNPQVMYRRATVQAFSVYSIRRARSKADAISRLGSTSPDDIDVIGEVYDYFGIADATVKPGPGAREQALAILLGVEVDT